MHTLVFLDQSTVHLLRDTSIVRVIQCNYAGIWSDGIHTASELIDVLRAIGVSSVRAAR